MILKRNVIKCRDMSAIFEFYAQFTLPAGRKQLSRRVGRCELGIKTDWWMRPRSSDCT